MCLLPSEHRKPFEEYRNRVFTRVRAGDASLIPEIEARAANNGQEARTARSCLGLAVEAAPERALKLRREEAEVTNLELSNDSLRAKVARMGAETGLLQANTARLEAEISFKRDAIDALRQIACAPPAPDALEAIPVAKVLGTVVQEAVPVPTPMAPAPTAPAPTAPALTAPIVSEVLMADRPAAREPSTAAGAARGRGRPRGSKDSYKRNRPQRTTPVADE
eukprot:2890347-Rhodomonas_salina.2